MNSSGDLFSSRTREAAVRRHFDACADATQWLDAANAATLAMQVAITQVHAPTGDERARGEVLRDALVNGTGSHTSRDAVGNIRATLPAATPTATRPTARGSASRCAPWGPAPVVVMAHLDTVYQSLDVQRTGDRITVRREGTRYCAPGITDNGRGLAALCTLHRALQQPKFAALRTHPIELVATVGEEGAGNLRGSRHYFDQRDAEGLPQPIAVIALDGPGDALVVHHAVSSARWRIVFDGPGGHPWVDVRAPNAIHAMGHAIAAIARYADALPAGATLSVARMAGGESLTSVPTLAWCDVDVRALDAMQCAAIVAQLHRLVSNEHHESPNALRVRFELLGDRPGGALPQEHPLVQLAEHATRWQGVTPRSASASSDANIPLSRGIAAITLGAGGIGGGAHTSDEWYDDTNGIRGLARALAVISGAAAGCARS